MNTAMETVRKMSKVTGTLIVICVASILLHHWYAISNLDYFDVVKAFMATKTMIGGIHVFLINLAFWVIVVVSVVSAVLDQKYSLSILSVFWVPMLIMCGLAILFIPTVDFKRIHLFWLICYLTMIVGLWLSIRQLSKFSAKSTDLMKLIKQAEGKPQINTNYIDFYVALGVSLLTALLLVALVIGAAVYGIGNRDLITGGVADEDDITYKILSIRYDAAVELMADGEYEKAMIEFRELNGYNDSKAKTAECEDLLYGPVYRNAISLMNRGKYDEARSAFWSIYDYKNSEKMIDQCDDLQYGPQYDEAIAFMNEGLYADALEIFQQLSDTGYRDSYEQVEACQRAIKTTLAGTWQGSAGSRFTLNEDMTCYYEDGGGSKGDGIWDAVDDRLVLSTNALSYELYGYLDDGYLTTSVLIEADTSSWNDETFTKE